MNLGASLTTVLPAIKRSSGGLTIAMRSLKGFVRESHILMLQKGVV
jgi:hypothetical protein